jgi:hypothetical protein
MTAHGSWQLLAAGCWLLASHALPAKAKIKDGQCHPVVMASGPSKTQ